MYNTYLRTRSIVVIVCKEDSVATVYLGRRQFSFAKKLLYRIVTGSRVAFFVSFLNVKLPIYFRERFVTTYCER
jgi:hypothetical protein